MTATTLPPVPAAPSGHSISRHLPDFVAGRREAVAHLWERFFGPCKAIARRRLGPVAGVVDEEDVVIEAFLAFCTAAQSGRFPDLRDRSNVRRLLAVFVMRKAFDARRQVVRRREVAWTESLFDQLGVDPSEAHVPPAEFESEVNDLLDRLKDDELRAIAVLRMAGHSREEVAARLGCSVATVTRRLADVRKRIAAATGQAAAGGES